MITQTRTAMNTLSNIFGNPAWLGTSQQASVIGEWDELLKNYSNDQVKTACLRYAKYKKDGKFPHLACIEAELVDVGFNDDASADKKEVANRMYQYCLEHSGECNPMPSKLATQRAMWKIYGVAVDGYNPQTDKEEQ